MLSGIPPASFDSSIPAPSLREHAPRPGAPISTTSPPIELQPSSGSGELLALAHAHAGSSVALVRGLESSLRRRDAILAAVTAAASRFLRSRDLDADAQEMLGMLGTAAEVQRVYLFEGSTDGAGMLHRHARHRWISPAASRAHDAHPDALDRPILPRAQWNPPRPDDVVHGPIATLPPSERAFFAGISECSFAAVPVFVGDAWWGYLEFADENTEREWSRAVLEALQAAAATLGAAIYRRRADDELGERETQLAAAQAMAHVGSFTWDFATDRITASAELRRIYGIAPDAALGPSCLLERVHPEDLAAVQRALEDARRSGARVSIEHRIVRAGHDVRRFQLEARIVAAADGQPQRMMGIGQDVTERREAEAIAHQLVVEQAARAAAEAERRRADFLAEASRVLGESFDYHTTLRTLTHLAVPEFADFATVDVVGADGAIERVGVAHRDESKEPVLWALAGWSADGSALPAHLRRALFQGGSSLIADYADPLRTAHATSDEHRAQIESVAPRSLAAVPLLSSGKVLGALVLYMAESGRHFDDDGLALAEELARRAALAVENARLFYEAEQATRAREQILGVVAHDLRNPLGTILMAAELLAESVPRDSVAHRQLGMVARAGDRMNHLIQDLLDVQRIQSGRVMIEPRSVAVRDLLDEAAESMRPHARAAGIDLVVEAADGLPAVEADPLRVQQVLTNLAGNAVKFTPRGGRITIGAAQVDGEVRFAVSDTGPGIAPDQLPHVFGRFWQARTNDRRGIGLGLTIAKAIVEAHHGRIWVESVVGEGSTFYFTLPRAKG